MLHLLPPPAPNKQNWARIWSYQFPPCAAGARKQFRSDHLFMYLPNGFTTLWPSNNVPPQFGCLSLGSVGAQLGFSRLSVLFGARGSLTAPGIFLATIHPLSSSLACPCSEYTASGRFGFLLTMVDNSLTSSLNINGIYIPAGLLVFGTAIVKREWTPYAVLLAIVLGVWKFYSQRAF